VPIAWNYDRVGPSGEKATKTNPLGQLPITSSVESTQVKKMRTHEVGQVMIVDHPHSESIPWRARQEAHWCE